jgi:hypothetical protein
MKKKNGLILTVTDNGKGITRKLIENHNSLGITGMRERALALGGTFTLGSSRSKGTILTVQIPLSRVIIGTAPSPLAQRSAVLIRDKTKRMGWRDPVLDNWTLERDAQRGNRSGGRRPAKKIKLTAMALS